MGFLSRKIQEESSFFQRISLGGADESRESLGKGRGADAVSLRSRQVHEPVGCSPSSLQNPAVVTQLGG